MITELARVQTEAQKQSFERNGFEEYTFLALGNACPICKGLDGKHFKTKDMEIAVNAPPVHLNCRCSVAAYEDSEDYEEWLDFLDKGGTTEEWNRLKKDEKKSIFEPEDKGDLLIDPNNLSDLSERSLQVNHFLNTLGLPENKWSGKTIVKSKNELKPAGRKVKNCDIWLREDAGVKTIIHEHLHARSVSRVGRVEGNLLGFEEGSVEFLAQEICKKYRVSYNGSYKAYVDPVRNVAKTLGREEYDFAIDVFNVNVSEREQWLKKQVDSWSQGNVFRKIKKKELYELIESLEE